MQGVLFDLDCTLVDRGASIARYAEGFVEAFRDRLDDQNLEWVAQVIVEADGWGYRGAQRAPDLIAGLTWEDAPAVDELDAHWRAHFPGCAVAMTGAVDLLKTLRQRGLKLGIVTNGSVRIQAGKIQALALREHVDAVVISEDVGVKKPHPRIFHHALETLALAPEDTCFVGDHPRNDILGAAAVGVQTVWLEGPHSWPADQPRVGPAIQQLAALPALLSTPSTG